MERLLEGLDRGPSGGLDLVPLEDLSDPATDVREEVQQRLVRLPDRLAEEDHDRLDPGAGPDREADRGPQSELVREFGPPEFGLLAEVPDPDGGIVLPHPPDEAQAGSGRGPGVRPLDPADVLQVRRMPAPIEPEDRCGGIVEPDLAEDPFLRLADRGEDFRRGLEERLRIDQGAGHGDLRRPMAVVAQPLRDVVDEGESGPAGEDRHFGREDFHVERRPVLLAVAPETDHAVVRLEDPQGFAEPRGVLLQADVLEGHRQEFGPRIAVLLDRRVVHVEEPEGLQVEHPHRQGVLLEQESIGLRFGAGTSLPALLVRIRRSPRDGDLARTGEGLESTKPARRPRFPIKAESLMISREMSPFGNLLTGLVPRRCGRTQSDSEPSPWPGMTSCPPMCGRNAFGTVTVPSAFW